MNLHQLTSTKTTKPIGRRGRGDGSRRGNLGGHGSNGQNARSGGGVRLGFEGGQTPLIRRMPKKRGFLSINREENIVINLSTLDIHFDDKAKISREALITKRLIKKSNSAPIKILGDGTTKKKFTLESGILFSASAAKIFEQKTTIKKSETTKKSEISKKETKTENKAKSKPKPSTTK